MRFRNISRWTVACILAVSLATALQAGWQLWRDTRDNRKIAALASGHDMPIGSTPSAALLAARGRFLVAQGDIDQAREIAERLNAPRMANDRAALLYALGNEHLRRAMQIFMLVPLRQVKPLVNAAKAEYRQSLQLNPSDWDCRYNFALAATLIHDRETSKALIGAQMSHDRATWPDIPGAPNGMP
jgi:mxaK protein